MKMYSTKTRSTHSFTMERAAVGIVRSTVSPALFYNSRHALLVLPLVLLVELRSLTVGRTVGVWFIEQRLDRCKNRGYIVGGTPTVLEDVQTYTAIRVDIWMKHLWHKSYCGGFVGVFFCELYNKLKCTILKGSSFRAKYDSIPHHDVVFRWSAANTGWRILLQSFKISHQSPSGRCWHGFTCGKRTDKT